MRKYTHIVHRAVHGQDRYSVAQLAEMFGKSESTLYAELNYRDTPNSCAKLGLDAAMHIMRILGDNSLVMQLCRECGLATTAAEYVPDKSTLNEEMLDDFPPVVDFQNAMREGLPVDKTAELCEAAVNELRETQVKYEEENK